MHILEKIDKVQDIIVNFGFTLSEVSTTCYQLSIDYRRKTEKPFDDLTNVMITNCYIEIYSDDTELLEVIAEKFNSEVEENEVII